MVNSLNIRGNFTIHFCGLIHFRSYPTKPRYGHMRSNDQYNNTVRTRYYLVFTNSIIV